jgi:hypothetical protein
LDDRRVGLTTTKKQCITYHNIFSINSVLHLVLLALAEEEIATSVVGHSLELGRVR